MKRTIFICDRCGETIAEKDLIRLSEWDLCKSCFADVKKFITGKKETAIPKKKETVEKKPEKTVVDTPKETAAPKRRRVTPEMQASMRSKRIGGASIDDIAEQFGISRASAYNHLKDVSVCDVASLAAELDAMR